MTARRPQSFSPRCSVFPLPPDGDHSWWSKPITERTSTTWTPTAGLRSQHYAFLVDDQDFDAIFARIRARKLPLLGRSRPNAAGPNQSSRRRVRSLLRGAERALPRNHHPSLRQRRVESLSGCGRANLTATWQFPRSSSWRRRAPSWCCRDRTADCRSLHSLTRASVC